MNEKNMLFLLLRSRLQNKPLSQEEKVQLQPYVKAIYKTAMPQGLHAMAGQLLADSGLLAQDPAGPVITQRTMQSFAFSMQQEAACNQICQCLTQHEIPFVPLKGAVIRKFYPEAWMRTSCDIDILVEEVYLETAIKALKEDLQYTQPADREYHDVALYSPQGVMLELHFSLKENNESLDKGLGLVWEHILPGEGCEKSLTPEFFVYHIVAHCAYHFMSSGCGAKPLLDLWLLKHRMGYEEEKVKALCAISGLERFYEKISALSEAWFGEGEMTPALESVGDYILGAGFGGSEENAVAAGVLQQGGKNRYIFSRLFLPYDMLKEYYPVLNRHKWLMPVCQVRRWFAGLQRKHLGAVVSAMKKSTEVSQEKLETVEEMFQYLQLH